MFHGDKSPDVVDMAFGWYHEAYIDIDGNLYVCAKAKISSIKIKEVPDGVREPLAKVTSLPRGTKVKQVSFTKARMFVLSQDGKLYSFRIEEKKPDRDQMMFSKFKPSMTGELIVDSPIHVKEIPDLKMISAGQDHLLALDTNGKVWAMGDDTFGQCGQGAENRQMVAPFFERRIRKPERVMIPEKVVKIATGYRHSLAITEKGHIFGWGYNNMQ